MVLHVAVFNMTIGSRSLTLRCVPKTATTDDEKCPVFRTQLLTAMSRLHHLGTHSALHTCQCEHTYTLKLASVNTEEHNMRRDI